MPCANCYQCKTLLSINVKESAIKTSNNLKIICIYMNNESKVICFIGVIVLNMSHVQFQYLTLKQAVRFPLLNKFKLTCSHSIQYIYITILYTHIFHVF